MNNYYLLLIKGLSITFLEVSNNRIYHVIKTSSYKKVGHHPHVIQGYEKYKGKYIFYSLGNFQFGIDNIKYNNSNVGIILEYQIEDNNITVHPIQIDKDNIPHLLFHKNNNLVFNKLNQISSETYQNKYFYFIKWYQIASKIYLKSNYSSWIYRIKKYGIKQFLMMMRASISKGYLMMFIGFIFGGWLYQERDIIDPSTDD